MFRGFFPAKPVLAGLFVCTLAAGAQTSQTAPNAAPKLSDAQVEASVLQALAAASDLKDQPITTTTVYGVVTLTGSVQSEAMRMEAENIVARTVGVQRVVDELTLSGDGQATSAENDVSAASGSPSERQPDSNQQQASNGYPAAYPDPRIESPDYGQPAAGPEHAPPPAYGPQGYGYPSPRPQPYGYPQQPYGYPQQQQPYGYPQQPYGYPQQQPGNRAPYSASQPYYPPQPAYGGQEGGRAVNIPAGSLIRVRISRPLDSGHDQPGDRFDGIVVNDVVADGAIAIPRGASIEGTVTDARSAGALSGRGELALQLTSVTLGGNRYPISSDEWAQHGGDKTVQSVDNTAIGAGLGGLAGAAAAGGAGAAVGAGVGAAIGLGSAASSSRGQVFVPAEGLLTFHLAQPVTVATLSQLEMDRLAQGAGRVTAQQPTLPRRVYAAPYYGPVYVYPYPYYRRYPYYPYPY